MSKLLSRVGIISLGAAVASGLWLITELEMRQAENTFIKEAQQQHAHVAHEVQEELEHIYESLRTLAQLPGIINIERHGTGLPEDTRQTFQQIYNNLAYGVDVSELYVLPQTLDPDKIDPVTNKPEEPILMFDELVIGGGKNREVSDEPVAEAPVAEMEEVEIHEYRQYKTQLEWLAEKFPQRNLIEGLKYPMISGPEIITCDNRVFNSTGIDRDRSGVSFSVPYYGSDGAFKGAITAIVLSSVIAKFAPSGDYAITNTAHQFVAPMGADSQAQKSLVHVRAAEVDPSLIYSDIINASLITPESKWQIWAGVPRERFLVSAEVANINKTRYVGFGFVLVSMLLLSLLQKNVEKSRQLAKQMEHERLKAWQDLTATMTHEIRSPLSAIRTAAFAVRNFVPNDSKVRVLADRIERNVLRSNRLLSDMMEYTSPKNVVLEDVEVTQWVIDSLEALPLDDKNEIRLDIDDRLIFARIDRDQMAGALAKLVDNAIKATRLASSNLPLTISCFAQGDKVLIEVSDSGIGIARDALTKVFDPMYTSRGFGTGLGLPITKSVVEKHGGHLQILSEVGRGTSVRMTLDVVRVENAKPEYARAVA